LPGVVEGIFSGRSGEADAGSENAVALGFPRHRVALITLSALQTALNRYGRISLRLAVFTAVLRLRTRATATRFLDVSAALNICWRFFAWRALRREGCGAIKQACAKFVVFDEACRNCETQNASPTKDGWRPIR
jgi:hypothetical protein